MSQQINLFTSQFRKQVVLLSADLIAAAAISMLVLMLVISAWTYYSGNQLRSEVNVITARVNVAQARLDTLLQERDPVTQAKVLDDEIARQESAMAERREVASVLKGSDFGDTHGYSDYLRAMARQIVDGVWIRRFDIAGAGRHFTIEGSTLRADLIPMYIKRLSGEDAMRGRQFATLMLRPPKPAAKDEKDAGSDKKAGDEVKASKPYLDFQLSSELIKPKEEGAAAASDMDRYGNYAKAVQ